MHGLQNDDKTSCYANAVLQCSIHLHFDKKFLNDSDNQSNDLSILAHRYESRLPNLKTYAVRQCLGDSFPVGVKQDVAKFFTALCIKFNYVRSSFEYQITSTKRLLNSTFSHWYQSREESCENCTSCNIMFKNELVLTKDIIVIHFIVFSLQNGKMMKTNKIHLRAVPTTK
ncbi:hypothetical protein PV328_012183, partial [Microctonus aethiopoides]